MKRDEAFLDNHARLRARSVIASQGQSLPQEALHLFAEEVITRLADRYTPRRGDQAAVSDDELDAFADALLTDGDEGGVAFVAKLRARQIPRDRIYLDYIAGAARRLGERWERDELPFTEVTIAAGHLYVVLRALRPTFLEDPTLLQAKGTALFASAPGETHTLGVTMAADLFRQKGWDIKLATGLSHDEIIEVAEQRAYPIIGLSASATRMIVPLVRLIASLRVSAPHAFILVSGELSALQPDLLSILDADAIANTVPEAIEVMEKFREESSRQIAKN